jgi:hypothetical protein
MKETGLTIFVGYRTIRDKLERIWKEALVAYPKYYSGIYPHYILEIHVYLLPRESYSLPSLSKRVRHLGTPTLCPQLPDHI